MAFSTAICNPGQPHLVNKTHSISISEIFIELITARKENVLGLGYTSSGDRGLCGADFFVTTYKWHIVKPKLDAFALNYAAIGLLQQHLRVSLSI